MQVAAIEFARNVCGMKDATSGEFSNSGNKIIDIMEDKIGKKLGGTMRLGAYPCKITEGSIMWKAYHEDLVYERHRHRYEFNNKYREILEKNGLLISGTSPDGKIVETIENQANDFFIGVQFHPEFKSRPNHVHPLFYCFINKAMNRK